MPPFIVDHQKRGGSLRRLKKFLSEVFQVTVYGVAFGHALFWMQVYYGTGALI